MKTRLKISLSVVLVIAGFIALRSAYALLNVADDVDVIAGVGILLTLLIVWPSAFYQIWKERKHESKTS